MGTRKKIGLPKGPNEMIVDPMGQWKYPGKNTRIPGNKISMDGVAPLWAVPNVGAPQFLNTNQSATFPGADYVDEFPMAKKGGDPLYKKYKMLRAEGYPEKQAWAIAYSMQERGELPKAQDAPPIFDLPGSAFSYISSFFKPDPPKSLIEQSGDYQGMIEGSREGPPAPGFVYESLSPIDFIGPLAAQGVMRGTAKALMKNTPKAATKHYTPIQGDWAVTQGPKTFLNRPGTIRDAFIKANARQTILRNNPNFRGRKHGGSLPKAQDIGQFPSPYNYGWDTGASISGDAPITPAEKPKILQSSQLQEIKKMEEDNARRIAYEKGEIAPEDYLASGSATSLYGINDPIFNLLLLGAPASLGLGAKASSKLVRGLGKSFDYVNPFAGFKGGAQFAKGYNYAKKSPGTTLTEGEIQSVVNKNLARINHPDYIAKRAANTGESVKQIQKEIAKYTKEMGDMRFSFQPTQHAAGQYFKPQFGNLWQGRINVNPSSRRKMIGVLDHEVKHGLSPLLRGTTHRGAYKNYPNLSMQKSNFPLENTFSGKIDKFFGSKASSKWDYYDIPFEQHVRFNRFEDIMHKMGVPKKKKYSAGDVDKGMDFLNKTRKMKENPNRDIISWLKGSVKEGEKFDRTAFRELLNKAWVVPAAVGLNESYRYGGSLPKAQIGIVDKVKEGAKALWDVRSPETFNKRLYETVTPIGYNWRHALNEYMTGKRLPFTWDGEKTSYDEWEKQPRYEESPEKGVYDKNASMDAWGLYLDQGQKNDTFMRSKYGKGNYDFSNPDDVHENIIYALNTKENWKDGDTRHIEDSDAGGFTLNNYKLKKGYDKNKELNYVEYEDEYDFDIPFELFDVPAEWIAGKPFDIKGRMYYKKDKDGKINIIDREDLAGQEVNFEDFKKGIKWTESKNGRYMKNNQSTASGFYGQLFDEIQKDYGKSRSEFIKDYDAQDAYFRKRFDGDISDISGTKETVVELWGEYGEYLQNNGYTPIDFAAIIHFLGRQGARKWAGNVLRDKDPLETVFPHLYKPGARQANKTPDEYIEEFRGGIERKRKGGEKIRKAQELYSTYKAGGEINNSDKKYLESLELIKAQDIGEVPDTTDADRRFYDRIIQMSAEIKEEIRLANQPAEIVEEVVEKAEPSKITSVAKPKPVPKSIVASTPVESQVSIEEELPWVDQTPIEAIASPGTTPYSGTYTPSIVSKEEDSKEEDSMWDKGIEKVKKAIPYIENAPYTEGISAVSDFFERTYDSYERSQGEGLTEAKESKIETLLTSEVPKKSTAYPTNKNIDAFVVDNLGYNTTSFPHVQIGKQYDTPEDGKYARFIVDMSNGIKVAYAPRNGKGDLRVDVPNAVVISDYLYDFDFTDDYAHQHAIGPLKRLKEEWENKDYSQKFVTVRKKNFVRSARMSGTDGTYIVKVIPTSELTNKDFSENRIYRQGYAKLSDLDISKDGKKIKLYKGGGFFVDQGIPLRPNYGKNKTGHYLRLPGGKGNYGKYQNISKLDMFGPWLGATVTIVSDDGSIVKKVTGSLKDVITTAQQIQKETGGKEVHFLQSDAGSMNVKGIADTDGIISVKQLNIHRNSEKQAGGAEILLSKKMGGEVSEVDKISKGDMNDEEQLKLALKTYSDYVNGVFYGSQEEIKAEKIYDKLNRFFYQEAKLAQVPIRQYVMGVAQQG